MRRFGVMEGVTREGRLTRANDCRPSMGVCARTQCGIRLPLPPSTSILRSRNTATPPKMQIFVKTLTGKTITLEGISRLHELQWAPR